MKVCPKCGASHEKPGVFCSRTCANSRGPRTEDFKRKVSEKLTGQVSPLLGSGLNPMMKKECLWCCSEYSGRKDRKYCSKFCFDDFCKSSTSAFASYKDKTKFRFNVYDFPEEFDLALLNEFGWYSASNRGNNLEGISRDHMVSVKFGFENNVDPALISHPANCRLMRHEENNRKKTKCHLSVTELVARIGEWNNRYTA